MIHALLGSTLLSGLLVSLRVQPSVILPPSVPGLAHQLSSNALRQTLTGTVVGYGEADENEWLIQTATGVVVADAGSREDQVIHIPVGEAVTLTGEWDDGEFDVITITRADGTQISTGRTLEGPPPWAGGRGRQSHLDPHQVPSQTTVSSQNTRLPQGQTLTGTVVGYGEADENEWLIQTATGVVVADAGSREDQVIDIPVGEAVTLTGEWDDGEFDVITITRADGTQIFIDSDS